MDGSTMPQASIRVLLVEDHEATRLGLTDLLNDQPDVDVVAGVATVAEALDQTTSLAPDVAVVDVQLPDGNGIALCIRIRDISPTTRCIIHTSADIGPETARRAGAMAVVLKQLSGNRLLDTIREARNDDR